MTNNTYPLDIGQIREAFRLETAGDAWVLVMDNDWPMSRPNGRTWIVEVPRDSLPGVTIDYPQENK